MTELLPCPMDAGTLRVYEHEGPYINCFNNDNFWSVTCNNNDCHFCLTRFQTEEDAIAAANTRAASPSEWQVPHESKDYECITQKERDGFLKWAEHTWQALQTNALGGYSGINRPFYIQWQYKDIFEQGYNKGLKAAALPNNRNREGA